VSYVFSVILLATDGRVALATVLRMFVCLLVVCNVHACIAAKRCVLPKNCLKKQIVMAYRKSNGHVTNDFT